MATVMWGVLGSTLVLALVLLVRRALAAGRRARAEVERIVRADLERLIDSEPVPEWPPGVERFFEIVERDRIPPIVVMPPQHRDSL
jgi:hypothetical protein